MSEWLLTNNSKEKLPFTKFSHHYQPSLPAWFMIYCGTFWIHYKFDVWMWFFVFWCVMFMFWFVLFWFLLGFCLIQRMDYFDSSLLYFLFLIIANFFNRYKTQIGNIHFAFLYCGMIRIRCGLKFVYFMETPHPALYFMYELLISVSIYYSYH